MRKKFFRPAVFGLLFCLSFPGIAHATDAPVAEVLTVVQGASVIRDGRTLPLERLAPLRLSDTVNTNATGRARILFADDSMVDLGANSSLDLRDFADSDAKSSFNVHLLQGVARVVTGKIVEQNPKGFAVTTPDATIGIRGTILSVRTGDGKTTTFVENTTRAVYVNDVNVPSGHKLAFPGDSRPTLIRSEDRRSLSRDLAFRGGAGAAAAAPEPPQGGAVPPAIASADTSGFFDSRPALAEATSPAQSLGDSLITPELTPTPPPPPAPTTAQYSTGTLSTLQFVSLNIGFTVNLSSGDVHDGYMSGTGSTVGPFNLSGGTGAVDSTWGTTSVQNFSGTPHLDGSGLTEFTILPYTPGDASVTINDAKVSDPYGADDALQYGELAAADIQ